MTDIDRLVERCEAAHRGEFGGYFCDLCREAAAALKEQQAKIESLRADVAATIKERKAATATIATLTARVKVLEAALGKITQHPISSPILPRRDIGLEGFPSCQDIARAALKQGETE
jgi:hypothetical protein